MKKLTYSLICVFIIVSQLCYAYNVDNFLKIQGKAKEQKSIALHKEALSYAESHELPHEAADSYFYIAYIQYVDGNYNHALLSYFAALKIARELNYTKRIASCLKNIGIVYRVCGQYDVALKYYNDASEYIFKSEDPSKIASLRLNVGRVYRMSGKTTTARESFRLALEHYKDTYNYKKVSRVLNEIGITYEVDSLYKKARKLYRESIKIASHMLDSGKYLKYRKAYAYNNIGWTYQLEHSDSSIFYFFKSLEYINHAPNLKKILYSNLGDYYEEVDSGDSSIFYYEKASNNFGSNEISTYYVDVYEHLANYYWDTEEDKSKEYLRDIVNIAKLQIERNEYLEHLYNQYQVSSATYQLKSEQEAGIRQQKEFHITLWRIGVVLVASLIFLVIVIRRKKRVALGTSKVNGTSAAFLQKKS